MTKSGQRTNEGNPFVEYRIAEVLQLPDYGVVIGEEMKGIAYYSIEVPLIPTLLLGVSGVELGGI